MVDTNMIINTVVPLVQILIYAIGGIIILGGTYYFLYHIIGGKKWFVRVYELRENGKLNLLGFDLLQQKRVMGGKRLLYWLKKAKVPTLPPSSDITQRVGRREYVDYIRLEAEIYAPMPTEQIASPYENGKLATWVKKYVLFYKKSQEEIKNLTPKEVKDRYIYIPANRAIKLNLKYDVSYDVDMMRLNAIDLRDLMWQSTKAFWEKYGTLIVGGLMLVTILAVTVLTFEHIQKVSQVGANTCGQAMKDAINQGMRNATTPIS